jgi:hypothetical protein
LFGTHLGAAEHTEAAGLADRRRHVAAMCEGEQGKLNSEQVTDLGFHRNSNLDSLRPKLRIVHVALFIIPGLRREWAQRHRAQDGHSRIIIGELGGVDLLRRMSLLYPMVERLVTRYGNSPRSMTLMSLSIFAIGMFGSSSYSLPSFALADGVLSYHPTSEI